MFLGENALNLNKLTTDCLKNETLYLNNINNNNEKTYSNMY